MRSFRVVARQRGAREHSPCREKVSRVRYVSVGVSNTGVYPLRETTEKLRCVSIFMMFSSPRGNAASIFREKAIELARSNLDLARIVARNKVTPDNSLPVSLTTFLLSKHARSCTDSFRKFKNSCHQMLMSNLVEEVEFELYESTDPLYLYFLDHWAIA